MTVLTLDIVLNLIWAAIGVFAAAGVLCAERRWRRGSAASLRVRRFSAAALAVICLFPAVSFSDDRVTLSTIEHRVGQRGGVGAPAEDPVPGSTNTLARQLQSLENAEMRTSALVLVSFSCVDDVVLPEASSVSRVVLSRPGRAPPSL